uniref:Integrase catalytic domain-containing protein n=1 Tax=Panagrolaimus sp. PS1159 TaxID=55785 RepID=A0AC35F281_9BILA
EVKSEVIFTVLPTVCSSSKEPLYDAKRTSSWSRLIHIYSYCLFFIQKCRKQPAQQPRSAEALIEAEKRVIQDIQICNPIQDSTIKSLQIFKDEDQLLRCQTRMENSRDSSLSRPLFLPPSYATSLLIQDIHKNLLHGGARSVLTELRQKYWIPHGLTNVKKSIKQCRKCSKDNAKPYALPLMPQLPSSRVSKNRPFAHTGVDYAGPFTLKGSDSPKRWVALFTCLTTRAVHLEVAQDLSTSAFINTFRRFISSMGTPETILSDNGANFKAAGNHIMPFWTCSNENPELIDYVSNKKITWKFITERAPWKGGIYERLIGIMKSALKSGIGRKKLPEEEFATLLKETQAFMNCRPLTDVEGDFLPLRPIDFLLPHCSPGIPQFTDSDDDPDDPSYNLSTREKLLDYLRKSTICLERTWTKWQKDYLTQLREVSTKLHRHRGLEAVPKIDEVVLIEDSEIPRGTWKIGKITEVHQSSDGEIRSASVKTANGNVLTRSPAQLYPLELNLEPKVAKNSTASRPASKTSVNSILFFLTLFQLFASTLANIPTIHNISCSNGELFVNASNAEKLTVH